VLIRLHYASAAVVVCLLVGCASSNDQLSSTNPQVATTGSGSSSTSVNRSAFGAAAPTPSGGAAARPDPNVTLPPGAALPTDLECAGRVVNTKEVRSANTTFNQTRGRQKGMTEKWLDRVTGDYSGTTDEILQWTACKWGIDVDIVRAQAAKESYWKMGTVSDFSDDPAVCPPGHPLGADGKKGQCPESVGIIQVRYQYSGPPSGLPTWPEAEKSTAYNLDFAYANWRSCYEGDKAWLNEVDRGQQYAAGDVWGCVGVWFSGRWYTAAAKEYIAAVQDNYKSRIWTTSSFINAR
jgi:hypothetical protein